MEWYKKIDWMMAAVIAATVFALNWAMGAVNLVISGSLIVDFLVLGVEVAIGTVIYAAFKKK